MIADYFFQSQTVVENKGKYFMWMMIHILIYSIVLLVGMVIGSLFFKYKLDFLFKFMCVNISVHCFVEQFTYERIEKYNKKKKERMAMLVLAIEQFIIISSLILTYNLWQQ